MYSVGYSGLGATTVVAISLMIFSTLNTFATNRASTGTRMGLDLIETCVCPHTRHNLTFQCTAVGTGNTIWRGSAFNCSENGHEISLRHSLFRYTEGAIAHCGNITGYSLRVKNNSYTSQISVVFSSHLLGRTIECVYDNGEQLLVIGNTTVSITTDPLPPPSNLALAHIRPGVRNELTFNWTRVAPDCTDVQYQITSDCGQCPTITNFTTVICHGVHISPPGGRVCSFEVKTLVCGHIDSDFRHLSINLKVPEAPTTEVFPIYSAETRQLISLRTAFMALGNFNITNGFIGSLVSYTISYIDATTGNICGSATIRQSSCVTDICIHIFDILSSTCTYSIPINITVSATNIFGTGPLSHPIQVYAFKNTFVNISVDTMSSTVICTFLQNTNTLKTCSILYELYNGSKSQCGLQNFDLQRQLLNERQYAQSTSNHITIGLPYVSLSHHDSNKFCFAVFASNGTHTALIEGMFSQAANKIWTDSLHHNSSTNQSFRLHFIISMPIMTLVVLCITAALLAVIVYLIMGRRKISVELLKAQVVELPTIYEEVDSKRPDMNDNLAYNTVQQVEIQSDVGLDLESSTHLAD